MTHEEIIARQTGLKLVYVQNTLALLMEGATIPFISRYRKEAPGGMTDVEVAEVNRLMEQLQELDKRRAYILQAIEGQGKLTDELRKRIEECTDAITLEDIYLPFKQKRRTRAQVAREAGLEPLANILQAQKTANVAQAAQHYINKEKGIDTYQKAIQGAQDIIAERVSENERARQSLRFTFGKHAIISSKLVKGKDIEGQNFRDYLTGANLFRAVAATACWPCVGARPKVSFASESVWMMQPPLNVSHDSSYTATARHPDW